eukprot:TRINITY_DN1660_c0_g1_i1.p1 TRINITY_DN1660_c0_g1~~TRINITY_DN1660_c0_g1_i1.p1  ORF type:complete len:220 (+),score=55.79 TRINITY_DN1660_c0_g1_i1:265-924(+)
MYADKIAAAGRKRSIKERLGINFDDSSSYSTQNALKRQRPSDEKWKHDLFEDEEEGELPPASDGKAGVQDLRARLQQKNAYRNSGPNDSHNVVKDLREKLSGASQSRLTNADAPKRSASAVKSGSSSKPASTSKPTPSQQATGPPASTKAVQKQASPAAERTVASLLQSLGLEKYLITFQAEEIDMTALKHMNDDDLRVLGIPMGPRKKILLALESQAK